MGSNRNPKIRFRGSQGTNIKPKFIFIGSKVLGYNVKPGLHFNASLAIEKTKEQ
jgi:hypothetical protein